MYQIWIGDEVFEYHATLESAYKTLFKLETSRHTPSVRVIFENKVIINWHENPDLDR